ncbi:MAG: hypothetical protein HYU75_26240 [Betaproteobacteria bacterium]|nr:hypothetical protein [Betaproteobacteria bacterium]
MAAADDQLVTVAIVGFGDARRPRGSATPCSPSPASRFGAIGVDYDFTELLAQAEHLDTVFLCQRMPAHGKAGSSLASLAQSAWGR